MKSSPPDFPTPLGKATTHPAPRTHHVSFERRFDHQAEQFSWAIEKQFEYGRWVLASLLAVNGGSLIAISQAGERAAALYASCGTMLIAAVSSALIAGGLAWINFTFISLTYAEWVQQLDAEGEISHLGWKKSVVDMTLLVAPLFAFGSLALFLWAAVVATDVLDAPKKQYWYNTETTADDPKA